MGLFNRKKETRTAGEVEFEDDLLRALLHTGAVDRERALQVPTVSGGIELIANAVAETPIKLYRDNNGRAEEVKGDYRLPLLNDDTGDTLSASEFWHAIVRDYFLGKGGYAYLNKVKGRIKSIHYVDERYVSVNKNNDPIFKDFDLVVNGQSYKPFDFLKILRNTRDGAEGVPITEENSKLINVAYQQLLLEGAMARRGGNKKGFLQTEGRVDAETMTALRNAWSNVYSTDSDNVVVLNKGLKFQEASDTAAEMQLAENKRTNASEFAKLFHISPETIGGSEANINGLAKLAAIPLMRQIECALNRDLLLEREKRTMYFAFDTKELLKGDIKDRFEAYKMALDSNFMQIDEVRYAEDLEPLDLSWIKLGLQDVLYDPKTKRIYTPNTNQMSSMSEHALTDGGIKPVERETADGTDGKTGGTEDGAADGAGGMADARTDTAVRATDEDDGADGTDDADGVDGNDGTGDSAD